jgi:DNA-binding CsgD family transcriptional regulator
VYCLRRFNIVAEPTRYQVGFAQDFVGEKPVLDKLFREVFSDHDSLNIADSGDEFLRVSCKLFGVDNLAYLGVNLPVRNVQNYYVHNTYSKDWAMRYETQNYVGIDPIVRRGMTSMLPIDWKGLDAIGRQQRDFFGESKEFGVGQQGLTFPVHGTHGETAVFSVSASLNDKDWQNFRRVHLKDMRIIAEFFHQRVLNSLMDQQQNQQTGLQLAPIQTLTLRELECLHWSAEGKTYEDIAAIMKITPRTVRFFLENSRSKLGSLNTTHAVVTAMARGLI